MTRAKEKSVRRAARGARHAQAKRVQPSKLPGLAKRIAKYMTLASACAALVAAVMWANPLAKVRELTDRPIAGVTIEGAFQYVSQQEVQAMLAERLTDNFLQLDMAAIKQVMEQNPWIDSVSLARQWPDRLVVRIKEQQPIARWGDRGFVNMRGDIIDVADNSPLAHLPLLNASDRHAQEVMQKYVQISRLLMPAELGLEAVHLDETLSWTLALQGGLEIRVGRERLFERLQRLLDVYPRTLAGKKSRIKAIDLRYDDGFAVAWKDAGLNQLAMAEKE